MGQGRKGVVGVWFEIQPKGRNRREGVWEFRRQRHKAFCQAVKLACHKAGIHGDTTKC